MNGSQSKRISDFALLLLLGAGVALFHALTNGQYGFHRDELDILMNARQLAWGYVAYPPFTPFIARIGLELFGPSLIGLRLCSALAQGVVVVLAGLMAKDMGGKRAAQIAAALAVFCAPPALTAGTLIQYMAFDYLWWVVIAFFTVRLLATNDMRWWLGIGAGIGLAAMTKYTVTFWVAGLAAAVLITSARRSLRSPWLWAGAGLALLLALPNLLWQVQHGFISLQFLQSIHTRDIAWGRTDGFLVEQLYTSANPFTLPLWTAGLIFCLFSKSETRFRALGWMFLVTVGLLLVTRGRGYYTSPAYAMLLAVGAVWLEGWLAGLSLEIRRSGQILAGSLLAAGIVVGVLLTKPVVPVNSALWKVTSGINDNFAEMIGWQDLTGQVTQIYATLTPEEKAHTAILAGNYGEAGALELYGPAYGLPRIISGANSLWERGYGNPEPDHVIVVGFESSYVSNYFKSCTYSGTVANAYGVKNEETSYHTGLYVCREPRQPWAQMWSTMRWYQ